MDLMRARFANLRSLSEAVGNVVAHRGLRGRFREIFVESMLAPYLPPTVELLSGCIVFADGSERTARNEDDVIVFDHAWAPTILSSRGRDAVVPVSGVRAHIEVKSNLSLDDLTDAVRAAAEINDRAIKTLPAGLIFAYTSEIG